MALDLGKFTLASGALMPPVQPANPLAAKLNLESKQGLINEKGTPNPSGVVAPGFTTSGSGLNFSIEPRGIIPANSTGVGTYAQSAPVQSLPTIQPAATVAAPAAAPATTPTAPIAAPAAQEKVTAPNFLPTLSGPNDAQEMISQGRDLMNTQGIGGFVQAKGLNRMAQTVNQTNAPLISGQYELQNAAMNANERLEQAKLADRQRQQQMETWTPDKNMMGELLGYGRTKGGTPQYVSKESLMAKPTLAQFVAKNGPLNPKVDQAGLEAKYKALYPDQ
jgi:hypothetical protein